MLFRSQNLYAQAAENAKKSGNAAKGTSVVFNSVYIPMEDVEINGIRVRMGGESSDHDDYEQALE